MGTSAPESGPVSPVSTISCAPAGVSITWITVPSVAAASHVVPYAVFFEQSLAIGKLSACLIGALLFYLTGSFMVLFIVAGAYSLLYMYI